MERIIEDIEDDRLGILYDPANLVTLDGYYSSGAMIEESFHRLGHRFVATHCKDVCWLMGGMQTGVEEVVPGRGVLDYKTFLKHVAAAEQELPLIIEHLKDPQDVLEAAAFIRAEAQELGLAID
jgi:sugar phosphate isomerase/epimerase